MIKTTKQWSDYWRDRKIDWNKSYTSTWDHPHRALITGLLKRMNWISLFEIGCGSGANLIAIVKQLNGRQLQLGGCDVNVDAVQGANRVLHGASIHVGGAEDIMMSDDSVDVVLSDMCLIYVDPLKIDKVVNEIKRIGRKYVILCEFHHTNWFKRLLFRVRSGYNAYNYRKLLEKHGFYDIEAYKIPEEAWAGGEPQKTFGYIIRATIPKRK